MTIKLPSLFLLLVTLLTGSLLAQENSNEPTVCIVHPTYMTCTSNSETDLVCDKYYDTSSSIISIDVPFVASEEDKEYTVDPITLPLNGTKLIQLNACHFYYHNWSYYFFSGHTRYQDVFNFACTNLDQLLDTSFISLLPYGGIYEPIFYVKGTGEVTVDFSYTKTIPAHHEGSYVPEKKVTTTVHLPIKIVDDSKTESDPTSDNAPIYPEI